MSQQRHRRCLFEGKIRRLLSIYYNPRESDFIHKMNKKNSALRRSLTKIIHIHNIFIAYTSSQLLCFIIIPPIERTTAVQRVRCWGCCAEETFFSANVSATAAHSTRTKHSATAKEKTSEFANVQQVSNVAIWYERWSDFSRWVL